MTFTKIFAAVILALIVAWIAATWSDNLVHPNMPAKNSYVVDTSAMNAASTPTATAAPAGPNPIEPLLASASVEAGEKTAHVCGTCHSFGKGEAAKIGPNLYGIVGNIHAHMAGYAYSEAMKAQGDKPWSFDELNHFLYNPRGYINGTKMSYAGLKNDQDRANVIAWLRTLADSPVPLPK